MWLSENVQCLMESLDSCHTRKLFSESPLNQVSHIWQLLSMSPSTPKKNLTRGSVLARVSIAMTKHHEPRQLWMKGFISFPFPHHSLSSNTVMAGSQGGKETWRQELIGCPRETVLTGFLFLVVHLHESGY